MVEKSFIFTTLLAHRTNATISIKNQFLCFSRFSPPYSTCTCLQNHNYNPHVGNFSPLSFCVQLSQQSTPKILFLTQPFSQFRLRQGTRELGSLVRTDAVLISFFFLSMDIDNRAHNH